MLTAVYGLTPVQYGFSFAFGVFGYIGGTILAQRLVGRRGMDGVIALGVLLLALGGLLMLGSVATGAGGAFGVVLSWAVYACGVGLVMPQAQASVMMPFPERAGAASSFSGLCQMLLSACVGLVVGMSSTNSSSPRANGSMRSKGSPRRKTRLERVHAPRRSAPRARRAPHPER